ncbi:MAG: hypothetical protein QNJ51_30610 [Calothrix sp. MO_167.B12]|nr:hypothetical protein [Calothrix sp. MO_167.B12]
MSHNPINIAKNVWGVLEGVATGDAGKTVWSTVKLGKSCVPFADFIPGLDEFVDGALEEIMETAFEPAIPERSTFTFI